MVNDEEYRRVRFVSFCAEMFARRHGASGGDVMRKFAAAGACEFLSDCYDTLHTLDREAILDEAETYLKNAGAEWAG